MDQKTQLSIVLKIKSDVVRFQVELDEIERDSTDDDIIKALHDARDHLFCAQRCLDRLNRFA